VGAGIFALSGTVSEIQFSIGPIIVTSERVFTGRRAAVASITLEGIYLVGYPIVFGLLCLFLFLQYGGFAGMPSDARAFPAPSSGATGAGDRGWVTFAYSWFLDSVTFNASQLGAWLPTPIHPTAWWSNALVWLFSVATDLVLFGALINVLRLAWWGITGRGTVTEQQIS
jgi:hypothetical protein